MPTAPSSADSSSAGSSSADPVAHGRSRSAPPGPVAALLALVRFRLACLEPRARRALVVALALAVGVLVVGVVLARTVADDPAVTPLLPAVTAALPLAFLGFLLTAALAAVASGGGRELVPADQAVALPVGPTTDHLGALLFAPLSVAWVLPAAGLLAAVSLTSPGHLVAALAVAVVWLLVATAVGQLAGWGAEVLRATTHGPVLVRVVVGAAVAGVALIAATGSAAAVAAALGGSGLRALVQAGDRGAWATWVPGLAGLVLVGVLALWLGALAARAAARRPARTQAAAETRVHRPRRPSRTVLGDVVRLDRASVWRAAPLRRGLMLLAVLPLGTAVVGGIRWETLPVVPGLVAAGGALLFGVNAWCLDAAGSWWRESLPVASRTLFAARAVVVAEIVLAPAALTLLVAAVRAGSPGGPAPVVTAVASTGVVCVRLVASAMRWSVRHPQAADLRRPRATPAPPGRMLAYSVRLALTGSVTGLLFTVLGGVFPSWVVVLVALGLLATSVLSLRRTARRWDDAGRRAELVRTVASL